MYYYKREEFKFNNKSELETQLNKEGDDGWEIIYYHETKSGKFGEPNVSIVLYKRVKK